MNQRLILQNPLFDITVSRLARQLIEVHQGFDQSVILGLQPRGKFLAQRIASRLEAITGEKIPLGYLDVTFHRDDFRRRDAPLTPSATQVPYDLENKKVILIDDVLFTGRTVRSALDAMISFGRPARVELLILIDRKYRRDLPIQPDYVGKEVNTLKTQRVKVEWKDQGGDADRIWLVDNDNV